MWSHERNSAFKVKLSEFLGKQQEIWVLCVWKCLCRCKQITKETASSSDNRAGVGLLSSFVLSLCVTAFTALSKEAQIPPFPRRYLGPRGSLGFIRSNRPLVVASPPLPEEPPWGTRGRALILEHKEHNLTPSAPGRTRRHSDRPEERKEKHQQQQKTKVLCLPCASWDGLRWQIYDHHPDRECHRGWESEGYGGEIKSKTWFEFIAANSPTEFV